MEFLYCSSVMRLTTGLPTSASLVDALALVTAAIVTGLGTAASKASASATARDNVITAATATSGTLYCLVSFLDNYFISEMFFLWITRMQKKGWSTHYDTYIETIDFSRGR